ARDLRNRLPVWPMVWVDVAAAANQARSQSGSEAQGASIRGDRQPARRRRRHRAKVRMFRGLVQTPRRIPPRPPGEAALRRQNAPAGWLRNRKSPEMMLVTNV